MYTTHRAITTLNYNKCQCLLCTVNASIQCIGRKWEKIYLNYTAVVEYIWDTRDGCINLFVRGRYKNKILLHLLIKHYILGFITPSLMNTITTRIAKVCVRFVLVIQYLHIWISTRHCLKESLMNKFVEMAEGLL